MRNRLVSTVGTSMLGNIRGEFRANNGVSEEQHGRLRRWVDERNTGQLAAELVRIEPMARICGAEINTIEDAIKREKVRLEYLDLLVSDTDEGKFTGSVLEAYYIERGLSDLRNIKVKVIDDLQDKVPARFKVFGLRNLVRVLGDIVKDKFDEVVIDATGGYKAQIAVAVVFGQALGIPVLYRHERFHEIIDFPPLPVSLNYELLGESAALLSQFERNEALTLSEIEELDPRIRVMLEEIDVDGEEMYEMGAVGQIFLTGFRLRFPRDRTLKPVDPTSKQPPSFRDDHYPKGFKEFVEKLINEVPWIKTCHSLPYHKQKAIKTTGFDVRQGKLIGMYRADDFGARFEILTNAEGDDQLTWAADQLNQFHRT